MDGKYTERGIVLLKRETQELSGQIPILIGEIEDKKKELAEWVERLEEKKRIFHGYDSLVASHFEKLRQDEKTLVSHIIQLKLEAQLRLNTLDVLREGIASIEVPEPNFSFAEQTAKMLSERINGLASTHESKKVAVDVMSQSLMEMAQEVADLVTEKEALEPRLEHLRSEIFLGNDKNGKMGMEYLKLQDSIASIRNRERNILFMQKQLLANKN